MPKLVDRARGAARFAWAQFFFPDHHNPHTQRAYESPLPRFLGWREVQGVEPASIAWPP